MGGTGGRKVPLMSKVESRFTGMIPLLARILSMTADGRLRPMVGLDMGYTFRHCVWSNRRRPSVLRT